MSHKHHLRRSLIEKRLQISSERRKEASERLFYHLLPKLKDFQLILSFASKEEEINLWPLNEALSKEKKLALPRIENKKLIPRKVFDLAKDLEVSRHWKIREPIIQHCPLVSPVQIDCALVPALGFDTSYHRLGYGKGHFDLFLSQVICPIYGIGFKEQLLDEPIPSEPHDVPMTELFLF